MTKEEFNKLWKDSTKEEILNQYYYDYKELQQKENIIKEVREIMKSKGYYHLSTDEVDYINSLLDKGD